MIEFNGIRSDERYLIVEHYPTRTIPKRRYTFQSIPGRSGDFVIDEGDDAFANYNQAYGVFLDSKAPGLPQAARGLTEWLLGSVGYCRLEDSYDPDFYRMAVYAGGEEFLNHFNEYGRGTLTFNCAPKRFYKSGEKEISLTNGQAIYSPSLFDSKPLYKITASGDSSTNTITITSSKYGTQQFTINSLYSGDGTVTIDPERHTVVNGSGVSKNSLVQSDYENLLLPSYATISWTGNIRTLKIIPRWWTV